MTYNLKKYISMLALGAAFVVAPGLSTFVQAQNWPWGQNRRNYPNDDYRYGRGSQNAEAQRGYRDGLRRGQEDARDRRRADPSNSSHYRNGSSAYREAFRDGYVQGYRQYARNGDYRDDDYRYGRDDDYRYGRNDDYRYGRNDGYGNDGYYRDSRYNAEYQKGYRDGLDRGMKDARTNRAMDPNNSSHYRKGNEAYREGFRRGFFENYRRYSNRRW